jgi:hypothetical protein
LTRSKKTTILRKFRFGDPWATVAQLAEHLTRNEDVCGSIPHGGSKKTTTYPSSIFRIPPFDLHFRPKMKFSWDPEIRSNLKNTIYIVKNVRLSYNTSDVIEWRESIRFEEESQGMWFDAE